MEEREAFAELQDALLDLQRSAFIASEYRYMARCKTYFDFIQLDQGRVLQRARYG